MFVRKHQVSWVLVLVCCMMLMMMLFNLSLSIILLHLQIVFSTTISSTRISILSTTSPLLVLRGGSDDSDYDLDYSDEEDEDDFDDLFDVDDDEDLFSMDAADTDFTEESTMDRMLVHWSKTPPLTKAYISSSVALTALGYISKNGNEFPKYCTLDWKSTISKLQLWRPITAFLNFGPFGLGYIMTLQFVWTYMSTLVCHFIYYLTSIKF